MHWVIARPLEPTPAVDQVLDQHGVALKRSVTVVPTGMSQNSTSVGLLAVHDPLKKPPELKGVFETALPASNSQSEPLSIAEPDSERPPRPFVGMTNLRDVLVQNRLFVVRKAGNQATLRHYDLVDVSRWRVAVDANQSVAGPAAPREESRIITHVREPVQPPDRSVRPVGSSYWITHRKISMTSVAPSVIRP